MIRRLQSRPLEIVVVERNLIEGGRIIRLLEASDILHRVTLIRDGAEALEFLDRRGRFARAPQPDLILLSAEPNSRLANELVREIRSNRLMADTALVLVGNSGVDGLFYDGDVDGCLRKPVDADDLLAVIRRLPVYDAKDFVEDARVASLVRQWQR